jgi:SAM-dependent methyltransferase
VGSACGCADRPARSKACRGSTRLSDPSDPRLYHAHVVRNRDPILDVLRRVLPTEGLVLEIASGSGEQAVYFAQRLPSLRWQPTDVDAELLASIAAHRAAADAPNLLAPLHLDAKSQRWPVTRADALVCINMIHITPWNVSEGLMAGARRTLGAGGVVYLYGPYQVDRRHIAPSNYDFDRWLRTRNAGWGIRDIADVTDLAARHGFGPAETVPMPANNLSVIFRLPASQAGEHDG